MVNVAGTTSRVVVAIDGPSGAGKSTLSSLLAHRLPNAASIAMESLYEGWNGIEIGVVRATRLTDTWRARRPGTYETFDWSTMRPGPPELVPIDFTPLILEGCGSGARPIAPDFLVWVDAPQRVRAQRSIARDSAIGSQWWQPWAESERQHFAVHATEIRADLRVDND